MPTGAEFIGAGGSHAAGVSSLFYVTFYNADVTWVTTAETGLHCTVTV